MIFKSKGSKLSSEIASILSMPTGCQDKTHYWHIPLDGKGLREALRYFKVQVPQSCQAACF